MNVQQYGDILVRSRTTILEMLDDRGYDVSKYKKVTGSDLLKMLPTDKNPDSLMMDVLHNTDPERRAIVVYMSQTIKNSVTTYVKRWVENDHTMGDKVYEIKNIEYIVMLIPTEAVAETFDKAALEAWTTYKFRVQFFNLASLVNNPKKHVFQPKFEFVPPESHKELLKENYCRSKLQFPIIRFHADMMARYMGLVPEDIVKITRPSLSAGEYVLYRTCAP